MSFVVARRLIGNIASALAQSAEPGPREIVQRLSEQNLNEPDFAKPVPKTLPVLRYWPECLAGTRLIQPDIAADLALLADGLRWLQSTSYTDAVLGEGFTENYGWSELIGPKGFFRGNDFLLGVLMLGPNRHYKDHFHPAPELYWPLTPQSFWRREPGGFVEKPAGTPIWHEPNQLHATITRDKPLLAVWSWSRDTHVAARLAETA